MHYSHFNFTDSFQLHVVQLSLPWYLRLCCHFMSFKIFMTSLSSEYNLLFSFGHPLNTIAKSLCRISLVKLNKDVLKVNTNLANRLLRHKIAETHLFHVWSCQGQQVITATNKRHQVNSVKLRVIAFHARYSASFIKLH